MYTVTVTDALSGDTEPQCIDEFATAKEARELAALHMEDAATYAEQPDRGRFKKAAAMFRKTDAMPVSATVDGFTVAVTADADAPCRANTTRGSVSDPTAYGCDLSAGHDGPHITKDPLGPGSGTYAWRHGRHMTRIEGNA